MINKQSSIWFLFLILTFFMFSCQKNTSKDCKQIKNGHFMWKRYNKVITVNRQDSIQIEREIGTKNYNKLSVHWVDDCHYELRMLYSNFQAPDSIKELRNNDVLTTEILDVINEYYIYECTSKISNVSIIDTMWIKK